MSTEELDRALRSHSRMFDLKIGRKKESVLLKAIQHDAFGDHIIHADFAEVAMDEKVTVTVPLVLHGTAAGLKENGTIEHVLHEIEVECLAARIPQEIRVEVSSLGINDQITVGDLELPEGVTTEVDPSELVVACRAAAEEVEEAAPPEEAAAMPEVITERKEDSAEEGGASGGEEG